MSRRVDDQGRAFVIFRVGDELYGLSIDRVNGIVRYEESTPVPRAPEMVMGVVNLRGSIIPVLDLSSRFGKGTFVPGPQSRIIVAEGAAGVLGLAVDYANEVVSIPEESIQQPSESVLSTQAAEAFQGIAELEGKLVMLLDLDAAVPVSEYSSATHGSTSEED